MAFPEGTPQQPIKKTSKVIQYDPETNTLINPNSPTKEQESILPPIEKQIEYYQKYQQIAAMNFDSYDQRDTNGITNALNSFFGKKVAESKPKMLTKPQQYEVDINFTEIKNLFNEELVKQELIKKELRQAA